MPAEFLDDMPGLLFIVGLLVLLSVGNAIGFRRGRLRCPTISDAMRGEIVGTQAAMMGLLALLLGFTFAMAISRFEARKVLVVKEANAIGTAALRAQMLPEAERAEMADLFRRYVDARMKAGFLKDVRTENHDALVADATDAQARLWHIAASASEADPRSVAAGMLVSAVNDVIDVRSERVESLANRIPTSVVVLLVVFSFLTSTLHGYSNGLADNRIRWLTTTFTVLIVLVLTVILDLDRPRRGLVLVSQEAMTTLHRSLESSKAK